MENESSHLSREEEIKQAQKIVAGEIGFFSYTDDEILLKDPAMPEPYRIPIQDCKTPDDAIRWILHLSKSTKWMTVPRIVQFFESYHRAAAQHEPPFLQEED